MYEEASQVTNDAVGVGSIRTVASSCAEQKVMDIIAVVKNGVIAEKGRHDLLIKIDGGVYTSICKCFAYKPGCIL